MKILIIRHADPDYSIDSLTAKGWKEAELLSKRISKLDVKAFYVSPLGRAQDTASVTLKKIGRTAETFDWLQEFAYRIPSPYDQGKYMLTWDFLPDYYTKVDEYYDYQKWHTVDVMREGNIEMYAKEVFDGIDSLLLRHGYKRNGRRYDAIQPNDDTIVLFCHFGVECYILSHILNISPVLLAQGFMAAPSSVTTLVTEERVKGSAIFRCTSFGDTAHLYVADEPPSFAGRFCENFNNAEERH